MLKQRVITAAILGAVFVGLIATLPVAAFAGLLLLVVLLGAWEWTDLLRLRPQLQWVYCLVLLVLAALLWWLVLAKPRQLLLLMLLSCVFWCVVVIWLYRYSRAAARQDSIVLLQIVGLIVLLVPWLALLSLRSNEVFGISYVLFLLVMIWCADSGAYFAGRQWGRRKLAPQISPGKTWEGVFGALAITLLMALLGAVVLTIQSRLWLWFIFICLLTVAFSIVGDLFESMIKRQCGVKDSGRLLPGHGGVLDRIDSLTAAAPLFLTGLLLLPEP